MIVLRPGKRLVAKGKKPSKTHPKGTPDTYEPCTLYAYRFTRPCGHRHESATTWADKAEAEHHEQWAKDNTLCGTCRMLSLTPEQRALLTREGRGPTDHALL